MKNFALLLIVTGCIYLAACSKDTQSEAFKLLTGPTWVSDSLLVNRVDASGPDGMLKNFKGEVKFNEDLTGTFGVFKGTWRFSNNETYIVLTSDSLQLPLSSKIAELTAKSLKVTTTYPNPANPTAAVNIRMTFKAK